jgi:hypothetical protein
VHRCFDWLVGWLVGGCVGECVYRKDDGRTCAQYENVFLLLQR